MPRKIPYVVILLLALIPIGCDTHQVTQFGQFAAAGSAYESALQSYLTEAGSAYLAQSNASAIAQREILSPVFNPTPSAQESTPALTPPAGATPPKPTPGTPKTALTPAPKPALTSNLASVQPAPTPADIKGAQDLALATLTTQDQQIRAYLASLQQISNHAALLAAWFASVTQLTGTKPSPATVASLQSLSANISSANTAVASMTLGGRSVNEALGEIDTPVVAHFELRALHAEIQKDAPVIETALALQQAAVRILTTNIHGELQGTLGQQENTVVYTPYLTPGALPSGWASSREAFLRQEVALLDSDDAIVAIQGLQADFNELVTHTATGIDFGPLMVTIGRMSGYVAAARTAAP